MNKIKAVSFKGITSLSFNEGEFISLTYNEYRDELKFLVPSTSRKLSKIFNRFSSGGDDILIVKTDKGDLTKNVFVLSINFTANPNEKETLEITLRGYKALKDNYSQETQAIIEYLGWQRALYTSLN